MTERRPRPREFAPTGAVVVRTPLLPFDVLARWTGDERRYLRALLDDPVIREAIFVSSPELDAALGGWLANPDDPGERRVEHALVRYVSRMAGRATPFGLMANVGLGSVGTGSQLVVAGRAAGRRHIRVDSEYLSAVCAAIAARPDCRASLRYEPSSSLYRSGGKLRYAEARIVAAARSYHLVVVEPSTYLDAVLERACDGAAIAELVAVLCSDPDVAAEDAEAFVGELIDTQILVPDLEPTVTGPEPLAALIVRLRDIPAASRFADALDRLAASLAALAATPLGAPPAAYRALADGLAELPIAPTIDRLFQVDLHVPAPELVIGQAVVDEVTRGVALLQRISGSTTGDEWPKFRTQFEARYGTREVPLVEVLDEETGIGFLAPSPPTAPLLELAFPSRRDSRQVPWDQREAHLLRLVVAAARARAIEIELTAADEVALGAAESTQLMDVIAVPFAVAAVSPEALAAGEFRVRLVGIDAPGARMLGRFCHGSPAIADAVGELVAIEGRRRPDAVFAEIVHLPGGRFGNLLARPVLRPCELPFLGRSGAARDRQLLVTDLMVSVVGARVVLRSRRLGKEIVPRLTAAHNFDQFSLGVYRFLCAIARQDGASMRWTWGALADAPFLPRVRSGRVVLSRARWRLDAADVAPFEASPRSAVAALRERLGLPRWIVVADGDNDLPVDLDNPLSVAAFASLAGHEISVELHELYPPPDQLAVHGPDGNYVHELVLLLARTDRPAIAGAVPPPSASARSGRSFPPGSNWLYAKYYTGFATVDELLRELGPLVRELAPDRWFFLRYGDPDWHLRIRIAGRLAEIMPALDARFRTFIEQGLVWKVQLDTYEREIERYGGPAGIDVAERIFAADSDAVMSIVEANASAAGADVMWRLALLGVDRLLDDLGLDLDAKRQVITTMRDRLGAEIGMDTAFQRRLGAKFRRHRAEIEATLGGGDGERLAPGIAAIERRSAKIRPLAGELVRLRAAGELSVDLPELAHSFIHLHVNRMLAASPRAQEVVLYDLLRRHYDGVAARRRS